MWGAPRRLRHYRLLAAAGLLTAFLAGCGGTCSFCDSHTCISSFDNGDGYIVQCADGEWSHSGGEGGACSDHGGETNVTATDSCASTSGAAVSTSSRPAVSPTPFPGVQSSPAPTSSVPQPAPTGAPAGPQTTPVAPLPESRPVLTGSASASSNGYSMTITSFKANQTPGVAGYGGSPPEFLLDISAQCQDQSLSAVWYLADGPAPADSSVATCLDGSFGSLPTPITVAGCGSHTLAVVVREAGTNQPLAGPMQFPFHLC